MDHAHPVETNVVVGAENYPKLMAGCRTEVEQLIDWLQSDARLDRNDVASEAHKIASNATLFGTTGFRNVLVTIERSAKAGKDAKAKSTIAALPDIWKCSKKALTEVAFKE
jgi:HPt (histidine-containing phosphotransfer) domain-containing protein